MRERSSRVTRLSSIGSCDARALQIIVTFWEEEATVKR
jgi:hypothetical protein